MERFGGIPLGSGLNTLGVNEMPSQSILRCRLERGSFDVNRIMRRRSPLPEMSIRQMTPLSWRSRIDMMDRGRNRSSLENDGTETDAIQYRKYDFTYLGIEGHFAGQNCHKVYHQRIVWRRLSACGFMRAELKVP